ncbi:restriction endonuclease subunit S [Butyribacter intestini]|uniref:restriction endonuclease subunit S n=1 Tax=Butyribacter intestini TaxID=1703332 RepID=UPI0022DECC7B|nr:restriction endonuclease subunit S [Butyribacter intestini]
MKKTWVNIQDVLFFQEGPGVRNTQYTTEGVKLLNVANLVDGKVDLSTSDRYISEEEAYGKYKHFLCNEGDFVIASSGIKVEYIDKKMGFIDKSMLPLCMNTSTIRFRVLDENQLRIRYFMYYLKSQHFKGQLFRYITGSAQLNYGPSHLKKMVMPLIDLVKQDEIIACMDKIQSIIEMRQQELDELDNLVKARFVEMFGDTVTNPLGWEEHRLDEFIDFLTSGSRGWAQYFVDNKNELFLTIKNVKNNHITLENIQYINAPNNKEADRTKVKAGDLLISITADIGRTGVVDNNIAECGAYINQHLSLVRLDKTKINPLYVSYFLETEGGRRQFESKNQNGVKAGLNFDAIKSLKILVPPLVKQNIYLDFVHQIDKSKVAIKKSLDETQILFDSLMQKYFG